MIVQEHGGISLGLKQRLMLLIVVMAVRARMCVQKLTNGVIIPRYIRQECVCLGGKRDNLKGFLRLSALLIFLNKIGENLSIAAFYGILKMVS
jgi:hypothetical protein